MTKLTWKPKKVSLNCQRWVCIRWHHMLCILHRLMRSKCRCYVTSKLRTLPDKTGNYFPRTSQSLHRSCCRYLSDHNCCTLALCTSNTFHLTKCSHLCTWDRTFLYNSDNLNQHKQHKDYFGRKIRYCIHCKYLDLYNTYSQKLHMEYIWIFVRYRILVCIWYKHLLNCKTNSRLHTIHRLGSLRNNPLHMSYRLCSQIIWSKSNKFCNWDHCKVSSLRFNQDNKTGYKADKKL